MERGWVGGHRLRREAEFDEGADVLGEEAIVDLVDVGEVVDGSVVGGLRLEAWVLGLAAGVVEADLIVKDGVEADGLEVGRLLYGAEIVAVALTEGEDRAAGAEGLLPEVRERGGGGFCVNDDFVLRNDWLAAEQEQHRATNNEPA